MVECRVNNTRRHTIRDLRLELGFTCTRCQSYILVIANAADFGVVLVDFEQVFFVPDGVFRATGLRADVIL